MSTKKKREFLHIQLQELDKENLKLLTKTGYGDSASAVVRRALREATRRQKDGLTG